MSDEFELAVDMAEGYDFGPFTRLYNVRRVRSEGVDTYVVEHGTRQGNWAPVGKKVNEGIAIGRALERHLSQRSAKPARTPTEQPSRESGEGQS